MHFDSDKTSQDIKATIAKVLASENITVSFKNTATAMFDPIKRRLIIPNYKDGLSREMYDLFIGHEVGHALFTPQIAPSQVDPNKANFGQFVNICEDVRIEKAIKKRFAGLVKSFRVGYDHLISNKFFGDFDKKPIAGRSFADRVNIHFKAGSVAGLTFVGDELEIVNQIGSANTWEETVAASHRLYDHCIDHNEDQPEPEQEPEDTSDDDNEAEGEEEQMSSQSSGSGDEDEDGEEEEENDSTSDDEDEDEAGEEESEGKAGSDVDEEKEADEDSGEESGKGGSLDANVSSAPPVCETQDAFDENVVADLLEEESYNEVTNVNIPVVDVKAAVMTWKDIYTDLIAAAKMQDGAYETFDSCGRDHWKKFKNQNKGIVSYMVKEFEMRKSADEHKRTSIAKTGVLDTTLIHKYRFSEEIFKRQAMVADGKNHGLVMIVDWSGSMASAMHDTLCQIQVLAMFCMKAKIPYEVYAFNGHATRRFYHDDSPLIKYTDMPVFSTNEGDLVLNENFRLVNYLSSSMKQSQFESAMIWIEAIKASWKDARRGRYGHNTNYGSHRIENISSLHNLGGTPLDEAMIAGAAVVKDFKHKHNLQIVNSVFLTDGEGNGTNSHYIDDDQNTSYNGSKTTMTDTKSSMTFRKTRGTGFSREGITDPYVEYFKNHTGGNIINFHICEKKQRNFNNALDTFGLGYMKEADWNIVKKNGFLQRTNGSYDLLLIIGIANLQIAEETKMGALGVGAEKKDIKKALLADTRSNVKSRLFLAEFMKMVA